MTAQGNERVPELTLGWRLKMALGSMQAGTMADLLGVSRQTLTRWMGDKGAPPKRAYLVQWALATGVDPTWLLTGNVSSSPTDPNGASSDIESFSDSSGPPMSS